MLLQRDILAGRQYPNNKSMFWERFRNVPIRVSIFIISVYSVNVQKSNFLVMQILSEQSILSLGKHYCIITFECSPNFVTFPPPPKCFSWMSLNQVINKSRIICSANAPIKLWKLYFGMFFENSRCQFFLCFKNTYRLSDIMGMLHLYVF